MKHTVGQTLREARERKGLSLSEAAARTKIKLSQLDAMERDDFSSMAAPLYVKGFIRLYAKMLGLDPAPLIESLFSEPAEPNTPVVPALAPENTSRMLRKKSPPSPEFAPTVSEFDPDAPFTPPASVSSVKSVPLPPPPAETRAPKPDAPEGSALARRLASAQAALNAALDNVKRPARPHAPAPPPSAPEPSAETPAFDFPKPAARASRTPAPKPAAPDLFAFAEQVRTATPPEKPAPPAPPPVEPVSSVPPAPAPAVSTPSSSVLSVPSVAVPEPETPAEPRAPEPAAAKSERIRHTASIFPKPSVRTKPTHVESVKDPAAPIWKEAAEQARAFAGRYGAQLALAAGVIVLLWALLLGLRACRSAPPSLPPDAPSGYAEMPLDPYLPPADAPAPPAAQP